VAADIAAPADQPDLHGPVVDAALFDLTDDREVLAS